MRMYGMITEAKLMGFYKWLKKENRGCCNVPVGVHDGNEYSICVGWHDFGDGKDGYANRKICWKIGLQSLDNATQKDLDTDFLMPCDDDGEVYDTLAEIDGNADFSVVADEMNKTARKVLEWCDRRK